MGFTSDKFKNLIEYKSGYTWTKDQERSTPSPNNVRVLTVTNIQEKLDLSSQLYLEDVSNRDKELKAVSKEWSIAVSSNGNRNRIGNAVYIDDDTDYLFASFLTGFIPRNKNVLSPKYFYYWLTSHPVQERITSVSEGTTGLANIDIRFLRNMLIEYPEDINEQIAIARVLTQIDEAVEKIEHGIISTNRLKTSLMQNMLTGRLKLDGTWRNEKEFYIDEKLGKIPQSWKVVSVGSLTGRKAISFNPQNTKEIREYVGMEHIEPGTFTRLGSGTSDETLSLKSEFSKGDVLLGKLRPYLNKVWFADIDGVCSTEFLVFPHSQLSTWLYLNFQAKRFLDYTTSVTAGTQHPRASWRDVKRYRIATPTNVDERKQIEDIIIELEKAQKNKQLKINNLKRLKKSLMQNLLTEKIKIDSRQIDKLFEEGL